MRTLLSTETVEEIDGCMAMTDVDAAGQRCVKFWIDNTHDSSIGEQAVQHVADEYREASPSQEPSVSVPTLPLCIWCEICRIQGSPIS